MRTGDRKWPKIYISDHTNWHDKFDRLALSLTRLYSNNKTNEMWFHHLLFWVISSDCARRDYLLLWLFGCLLLFQALVFQKQWMRCVRLSFARVSATSLRYLLNEWNCQTIKNVIDREKIIARKRKAVCSFFFYSVYI